jgi:proteic killer suppression protein
VFGGECLKGFPADIVSVARRKLIMLDQAADLNDLPSPPGDRLKPLERDRRGQKFHMHQRPVQGLLLWTIEGPAEVEVTDYH